MDIGKKIKDLRTKKGLSQEDLGKAMGVHYTHISRYERNQSTPSIEALKKLATIFEVSADYLLFDDVDKMAFGSIRDTDLLQQFRELDSLDEDTRSKTKFLIEAVLTQQHVKELASKSAPKR
jgi:transcriptional regulator with XRE-family HTH domain